MIQRTYFKIAGNPISKNKKGQCSYCIRPTEKKYLCEDTLEWISTCCSDGCYCSPLCEYWILDNGFCVFHSRITFAHGYNYESREAFIVGGVSFEVHKKLEGRTFKEIAKIVEEKDVVPVRSKITNIAIIYNNTLANAAKMHFLLREIFHLHLLPELYPAWIWST